MWKKCKATSTFVGQNAFGSKANVQRIQREALEIADSDEMGAKFGDTVEVPTTPDLYGQHPPLNRVMGPPTWPDDGRAHADLTLGPCHPGIHKVRTGQGPFTKPGHFDCLARIAMLGSRV